MRVSYYLPWNQLRKFQNIIILPLKNRDKLLTVIYCNKNEDYKNILLYSRHFLKGARWIRSTTVQGWYLIYQSRMVEGKIDLGKN